MIEAVCTAAFAVAILVSMLRYYKSQPMKSIVAMVFIWLVAVAWTTKAVFEVLDAMA